MRGRTAPSSNPKRILFYGACHATVFAQVFESFCTDPSYSFDRITNYEIIQNGIPFPYERVSEWDVIVFSPIFNQPGYETARLIEECLKKHVKTVCYPHLHWRGYFPYIDEGHFITMPFWHYPTSVALARTSSDFESFKREFDKPFKEDYFLFENLESTTEYLRKNEIAGNCDFIISDFIVKEFRDKRLFLIPGHPSQTLYIEAIRRLNEFLNLPLDPSYTYSVCEPQHGVKVPIHPDVSARLGLRFQDADFQNNLSIFADRTIPWSDYLRLAYGSGRKSTMWRATAETAIKISLQPSVGLTLNDCIWMPEGAILQARAQSAEDPLYWKLDVTWADPGIRRELMHWETVYIYKGHWQENVNPA